MNSKAFRPAMIAALTACFLIAPLTLSAAQLQFTPERFASTKISPCSARGGTPVGATPISIPRTVDRPASTGQPVNQPALDPGLGP